MTTEFKPESQSDDISAAVCEQLPPAEPDTDYLTAPRSYKKEYAETFKTLPPAMRKYLHERESETEKGFSRINNELNNRRWIDDAFASRSSRLEKLGINKAQDWVETMARIDDALAADPNQTLHELAQIYGVKDSASAAQNYGQELTSLQQGLAELNRNFSQFAQEYKAKSQDDEQIALSKKAREASFAPKGKNSSKDLSELTTREVLELKFADYDD